MNNNPKFVYIITWSDGMKETVQKSHQGFHWGLGSISSHVDGMQMSVEGLGGSISRQKNPHWVSPKAPANPFAKFF